MTREEKMFFDEIEKKSKNNPIIKIEITAEEISDYMINKCRSPFLFYDDDIYYRF